MQLHFLAAVAAVAIPVAIAQSLSDLPACAQQAGLSGIEATGCSVTDIKCICNSVPFINTLRAYIEADCAASDQAEALMFAQQLCATVGITISATVTGLPTTPASVAPASTPADVGVVTSLSGVATSTISPTNMGTAGMPSTTPTASDSVTGSTSSLVAQFTGGVGHVGHGQELAVAVAAVGVIVMAF